MDPWSTNIEAGHSGATDLTQDFSFGNSDAIDILTLGLGLGLGRVLGLELGCQDVSGLKNTVVNFLASGWLRQDDADPPIQPKQIQSFHKLFCLNIKNKNKYPC